MVSAVEPGDRVLVLAFGRFGQLKAEIARRVGADLRVDRRRSGAPCSGPSRSRRR